MVWQDILFLGDRSELCLFVAKEDVLFSFYNSNFFLTKTFRGPTLLSASPPCYFTPPQTHTPHHHHNHPLPFILSLHQCSLHNTHTNTHTRTTQKKNNPTYRPHPRFTTRRAGRYPPPPLLLDHGCMGL